VGEGHCVKPQFFSVVDFDELQHYKHRSPPWIKLYARLWEKPEFEKLSDINKAHYLGICVLASRNNNRIPMDNAWIEKHISATNPLDLKILFASNLIAPCKHNALSEKRQSRVERETEKKTREGGPGETNGNGHRPTGIPPFLNALVSTDDPEERAQAQRDFQRELQRIASIKQFP
jgi:hypothetical protein